MRNAQKREVLGCMDSLHQAHEEIRLALKRNDSARVQNMLSECQEFAVSIGENIEKLEGKGHITVSYLEGYCETLYRVYEELGSGGTHFNKVYKTLRKQLLRVESSARHDIRVRKEVVFLPYKASMWDSLESVWKAAEEDEDTDAYVVPIPYYDRNPNGSFGEEHYEGDLYPEYVPIVKYDEYDFESRRPDMIYIHNPYDDANYVTSVHPFFYSVNLRKFTDKLVYIPYFVLEEIDPKNQAAVEGIKHFCILPGIFHAHKVIVQSEDMRRIYINVLTEETVGKENRKKQGEIRKYWEDKIDGIGSPKFDKVADTEKKDIEIPEKWKRIIKKPDGTAKKIVFYNNSINALLQHNEDMIIKMRSVFGIFKEHRDEIALLWRPHPLIESTLLSMRPQVWEKYREIRDRYVAEGWGIYDDTPDIDRAIALSDAYYGDASSVVQLCSSAGIPVMLQGVDI